MFYLAGLLGLMAMGAAAFVGTDSLDTEEADENDLPEPEGELTTDFQTEAGNGEAADGGTDSILPGTDEGETLGGGSGNDQINGYDGDDLLEGWADWDQLFGGAGDDTLDGGEGDDTLHGGDGDDLLAGGAGDDNIFGHFHDDTLFGGAGGDSLHGGMGDDLLDGGEGADALHGGYGDDTLLGGTGEDTLFGGPGDDLIVGAGDGEADYLNGGAGDDLLMAGSGDIVTSGEGADTITLHDRMSEAATVIDYDPDEDNLVLLMNEADVAPDLSLVPDADDPGTSHLLLDGVEIAAIRGGGDLSLADITLLPQDSPTAAIMRV
ncbi:Hemolysin-type calcium-binding repeat-containing protein [Salinihabitans flavidus]|uniref:Hemolysin-type calcium-binding repeat-containing protein n=1 Tax=Salinihabitans flavidus TaxID=569882 RepID=A0A1H8UYQ8_9RHOB|nr:calcium-binding protein [Salinihabitans flavidus]SEP08117.1 Hemolysin-type calcium-binding repeat-containing protein [Salinihabitans flavidus]